MRFTICVTAALAVACVAGAARGEGPLSVYANASLVQNFAGGFDYLPNGDLIGMYSDPTMVKNAYLGIIDANGDGDPAVVKKVHAFKEPTFGIAVDVSPDGMSVLFGESSYDPVTTQSRYALYHGPVNGQTFPVIDPAEGSLEGAYDIVFIDATRCYISANPGDFSATTNKIWRLDLETKSATEVVSIEGTYSGLIDVDKEGNLYYVRGKANYPPRRGDFTLMKFAAAALDEAAAGDADQKLDAGDATVVAENLDGGQDVAWHRSGAVFVSDANNRAVYEVAPDGTVSRYAEAPGRSGEGFWFLAIRNPASSRSAEVPARDEIAASWQPLFGTGEPDVIRLSPQVYVGERLLLTAAVDIPGPVWIPFDAYVVLSGPGGIFYSALPGGGVGEGIRAYAEGLPGLAESFLGRILDLPVPDGTPKGLWTVYAGLMPAGRAPSPQDALALDTVVLTVR